MIELSPDYYLKNFHSLLDCVWQLYKDLLLANERQFYTHFGNLSVNAQRLLVRLLTRKGPVFRQGKLSYSEISSIARAVRELSQQGFIETNPDLSPQTILSLYNKAEIIQYFELSGCGHLQRSLLLEKVLQQGSSDHLQKIRDTDPLIQLSCISEQQTFLLLFFGNLYQDLSEFVLRDLGLQTYEDYPLNTRDRFFASRQSMDQHRHYYQLLETAELLAETDPRAIVDFHQQVPRRTSKLPVLGRRLDRLRNRLARQLERLGDDENALQIYQLSGRPPSRERQARILARQDAHDDCLRLCKAIQNTPLNEEEYWFASNFAYRIAGKTGRPWQAPVNYSPSVLELQLPDHTDGVEAAVCDYYSAKGRCFHVENHLFNGMLGLFIWDIVFLPIQGAFFNPFQFAPADFYEPEFLQRRHKLIDKRFSELANPVIFRQRVLSTWSEKFNRLNPLVHWPSLNKQILELAVDQIPTKHWDVIFRRLLQDRRYNRSGLPDLVYFPFEGDYQLLEVKGPGDRLQKNQQRWMHYFEQHKIPHELVRVRWTQTTDPS